MPVDVELIPVSREAQTSAVVGGTIVLHPRYERFLRRCGLDSALAALTLPGEIVGGHADRHVARVELRAGPAARVAYLKREHVVGRRTRLRNRFDGFGSVSRCEREAVTLQRLEAAGLPGPQWLAYGTAPDGRAFLLVDEVADAVALPAVLRDARLSRADRRTLAERVGRTLAELHDAGFGTPDLSAKHLLVGPVTFDVALIDWQSAKPPGVVPDADRARQLAALHASLADPAERLRFLWAYLRVTRRNRKPTGRPAPRFGAFARSIQAAAEARFDRSSVRDQRSSAPAPRLVWLAGEAVCVVPELADAWPRPADGYPFYEAAPPGPREWVTFADGRRGVLARFRTFDPCGRLTAAVREKPWRSPAAKLARLLFHLHRHGVPGPALLAFGQRTTSRTAADSFVVFDPPAGPPADQLDECAALLSQLHDAGCRPTRSNEPLFVATDDGLAVGSPSAVRLAKRITHADRAADLDWLTRSLAPRAA